MMHVTLALACALQGPESPDLVVTAVPGGRYAPLQRSFAQHVDVFGVKVFGTRRVPRSKLLHVATVLAEYLDNDEDGAVDNEAVLQAMVARDAFMAVFGSEREMERLDWERVEAAGFTAGQGQFVEETAPGGGRFDATLEEVLHLVTHVGYANAYPEVFGERADSELGRCLDRARGGRFERVPTSYPDGAWFTYDDATCDYGCQCAEYLYWAVTSVMGAQEAPRRRREIAHEWRLPTAALVAERDPGVYALIASPRYRLPTRLPDGVYRGGRGPEVERLAAVAGAESGEPDLCVGPDGVARLSWVEELERGHALRFARLVDGRWSRPQEIARGERWFVNWADFPSLTVLPSGAMVAHWRQMSGAGTYDYDVLVARSEDGGVTWGAPQRPHRDGVQAEHGFVSTAAVGRDGLALAWLDGRAMKPSAGGHGAMTLRYAELTAAGALASESLLDPRVCECCQTSMAWTSQGPLVVYRDRSDEEVRDIACVRRVDGRWTAPRAVSSERWRIGGCPVNGPSVAARGDNVVVAYFTAAAGRASVRLTRSSDAGATFGEPLVLDDQNPPGRVEVALATDGAAWLCWLGRDGDEGVVLLRRVGPDGSVSDARVVARTGTGRGHGFPQLLALDGALLFAWTDGGVQTARLPLR
ncbi:MAG: exo-alpha-sialidase [Planctomycetota bacterium]